MVRGTNLRRTLIVCATGPGQTTTVNSFTTQHGNHFVASLHSFTCGIINNAMGMFACLLVMIWWDKIGRKTLILTCALRQVGYGWR
jgi:hypothetical protein